MFSAAYADDVMIVAENSEPGLQMVAVVLVSPRQDSQATPKKCVIWRRGGCLGNLLTQRQVRPQLDKSTAITTFLRHRLNMSSIASGC